MQRPVQGEYGAYFAQYIDLVGDEPLDELMRKQLAEIQSVVGQIPEDRGGYRYAEDKWSVRQVIGHMGDTERIMAYRLLCISRGEQTSLPGFDQSAYVANSSFESRTIKELLDDFSLVRASTLSLMAGITDEGWLRKGMANNNPVSARAVAYIMAGHAQHHMNVLKEQYLQG